MALSRDAESFAADNVRRFRLLLWLAVLLFAATEAIAFLGVVPHLRPVSLRDVTANILFAIGFGIPIVLHLSTLPRPRELAGTAALGGLLGLAIWGAHRWAGLPAAYQPEEVAAASGITGLGLASLAALGLRAWRGVSPQRTAALAFLLPSAAALVITVEAGIFLYFIKALFPTTRDPSAYAVDAAYGVHWSFAVGRLFAAAPWLRLLCFVLYVAPPPLLVFVYALQMRARRPPPVDAASLLLAVFVSGYALYFVFPVCGPLFAFGAAFPNDPPPVEGLVGTRLPVPGADAWPNGMPSLHLASVILAAWQARPFGRLAHGIAAVFVAGTFLATLGLGEHYLIDLVVALPLCLTVYAVCTPPRPAYRRQWRAALLGGILLLGLWYLLLFFGIPLLLRSVVLTWAISLATLAAVVWLERRLSAAAVPDPWGVAEHKTAPGPRGHFLLGNLLAFRRDVLGLLLDSRREFGDVVRFRLGPMLIHLVSHPDGIKRVLVTQQHRYNKATRSSAKIAGITGEGLLTNNGDAWLRPRRLLQPLFQPQRLTAYTGLMVEETDRMLDLWQARAADGQPLDVAVEMMRLTCAIIARVVLGADVGADIDEIGRATTVMMAHTWRRLERIADPPLSLPTPGNRRFRRAKHRLDAIVSRLIAERRGGAAKDDLLALAERAGGLSERQLHDEAVTLLLAGHETTANALTWTWHLLASHPRHRQEVRDEVTGLLGDRPVTADELPRLDLLTRVFQEAMRLFPPIWIMERRVLEDDEIGGYHIPAGSAVEISPYVTHRHPEFWHEPERFDPERFTAKSAAGRPQYAYLPFGGGQRLCIGSHLALLEARVILSRVLQRFELRAVPGFAVEKLPGITLRPRHGLIMTVHPAGSTGTRDAGGANP